MKTARSFAVISMVLLLALSVCPSRAEDTVTVPKSRLEELERKEAELEKLKAGKAQPQVEPGRSQNPSQQIAPSGTAHPATTHTNQFLASLAPLKPGETVSAVGLANHYRTDAAAADQRYRKRTIKIEGEIAGFEKPLLTHDYKILLKTDDPLVRVICEVYAPQKYSAVFADNGGTRLVGLVSGETRVRITKIGAVVVLEGRCRGLGSGGVKMTGCELKSTH